MGEVTDTALRIIQLLLVALFGAGGAGGFLAWRAKRRAAAAEVAKNTQQAAADNARDRTKELRLLIDYVYVLRASVRDLGGTPPTWPDDLQHLA